MSRAAVIALLVALFAACGGERTPARVVRPTPAEPPASVTNSELTPELAQLLLKGPGGPVQEDFDLELPGDRPRTLRIVLESTTGEARSPGRSPALGSGL